MKPAHKKAPAIVSAIAASSNIWLVTLWLIHGFYSGDGVLEDKDLPFGGLDLELIGIV